MPSVAPHVKARLILLGAILLAHSTVWTIALRMSPGLVPARQMVAESISTLALVLLSTNLTLAARTRFFERRLRGLDKLFATHRTIGLTVALLVSAHFLIVPKSVGYVPSKPVGYTTLPLLLLAIFIASAPRFPRHRLVPLKYQTWKLTHRFMGVIVAMAVTHSLLAHPYVRRVPVLAGYVYGVAALGLAAWLYRELLFGRFGPFHTYRVERSRPLGSRVTEITLSSEEAPPALSPGSSHSPRSTRARRASSTPSRLAAAPETRLASRSRRPGTSPGTCNRGSHMDRQSESKDPTVRSGRPKRPSSTLARGGIGITPFLSMAADLGSEIEVLLVWSVHTRQDAITRMNWRGWLGRSRT